MIYFFGFYSSYCTYHPRCFESHHRYQSVSCVVHHHHHRCHSHSFITQDPTVSFSSPPAFSIIKLGPFLLALGCSFDS